MTSGSLLPLLLGGIILLSPQRSRWEKGTEPTVGSRAVWLMGEARGSEGPVRQRVLQTPTKLESEAIAGVPTSLLASEAIQQPFIITSSRPTSVPSEAMLR